MAEKVTIIYSVVDEATTKLGKIAKGVKGIGTSSKTSGTAMSSLGSIAKTATSMITAYLGIQAARAVVDFAKESVQAFADFEYAMAGVAAKLGTTLGDVTELSETARRVGIEYGVGAHEAAKGLVAFAAAGFDATESALALDAAVKLAIVSGTGMEQSAVLLVRALSVFGAEADEAARYVDVLVAADLASTAAAADLATALGYSGASAKSMGLDVYDALTAISILTDRVGGAAKAGRYFDALLRELRVKSEDLGVEIYTADGRLRDFSEIIVSVSRKMEGMTVEQKNAWLTSIGFTSQAMRAILALADVGEGAEDAAKLWAKYSDEVDKSGKATEAVDTMMNTLTGSINVFNASMQDMKIAMAEEWTWIDDAVKGLTEIVQLQAWLIRNPQPSYYNLKDQVKWYEEYEKEINRIKDALYGVEEAAEDTGEALDDFGDSFEAAVSDMVRPLESAVDEINRLIREGLVGDAQDKFADFAKCTTNKAGQMALSIQDDIWGMVVDTEEGYARLLRMAEEMPEGPARQAAITGAAAYRTAGYERIEELESILNTLLTGGIMPSAETYPDIPTQNGDVNIDMDINIVGIDSEAIDLNALSKTILDELLRELIDAGVIGN